MSLALGILAAFVAFSALVNLMAPAAIELPDGSGKPPATGRIRRTLGARVRSSLHFDSFPSGKGTGKRRHDNGPPLGTVAFCTGPALAATWLKYAALAWDIILVTLLLMLTGDPRSWLAVLYFLVIASAPLRLSLPTVYAATLGSMAGYLVYLGYLRWGLQFADAERLSRTNQIIVILALGTVGFLAGQVVRQARRLVRGYPVKVEEEGAS